jgi:hypothetical protein
MIAEGTSLLVCTPVRGGFSPSYSESVRALEAWARSRNIPFDIRRVAEAPVDAARDVLAASYLVATHGDPPTPYSHCLMVDAGVGFGVETIEKLLSADEDFVAAAVPLRNTRVDRVAERGESRFGADFAIRLTADQMESGKAHIEPKGDAMFIEVDAIGAAMICLRRAVFTRIFDAHPELQHKAGFGYFLPTVMDAEGHSHVDRLRKALRQHTTTPEEREKLVDKALGASHEEFDRCGEDVAFCRRWRALHSPEQPARIWVLCDAPLVHEGHGMFQGNFESSFG